MDRTDDIFHQLVSVERAAVGEFAFSQRPNAFVGVELGSISRKVLDVQARVLTEELCQRSTLVRGGIVQQNDDGTSEVPKQLPEKQAHFFLAHVVEVEQIVEAQALLLGADRDSGDDGDFIAASLAMRLKGGAALGCPSLGDQRSQQKA